MSPLINLSLAFVLALLGPFWWTLRAAPPAEAQDAWSDSADHDRGPFERLLDAALPTAGPGHADVTGTSLPAAPRPRTPSLPAPRPAARSPPPAA